MILSCRGENQNCSGKEVIYDYQEKACRDRIEKEYASKLRPLESAKKDKSEKIKEYENKITSIENKTSELKTESSKLVKELHSQIDSDTEKLKDLLKHIFEIEISKRQKQISTYSDELANVRGEYENIIKFIEELNKTIRRYEIDINNLKKEINKLNELKDELQHNLNIAKEYLFFIKNKKLKYLAYRAGIYSPSFLNDLIKYGLHKKEYNHVVLRIKDLEQELIFLEGKQKEVFSNKGSKEELKNGAEKLLDESEKTKQSLESKQNKLTEDIEKENSELDFLSRQLILIERIQFGEFPSINDYAHLTEVEKAKDELLHMIKAIEENRTKSETIERESTYDVQENGAKIKTLNDIILNLNRELESIEKNITFLETEKATKLGNITALVLKRYDIIATTIFETAKIFKLFDFDLTIIDEAGAVEVPSALIPMIRSKKIILLGDHKQLPPVIREDKWQIRYFLDEHPELRQSIFELLYNKVGSNENCVIMLEEQYRMHKNIAEFVSKFYENKLKTSSNVKTSLKGELDKIIGKEPQLVWFLREYWNEKEGKSSKCRLEVSLVKNIVANFKKAYGDEIISDIGVITPFQAQYRLLKEEFKKELPEIECGTVHKYQGREKKIIIFSPAESKKFGPLFTDKKGKTLLNPTFKRFIFDNLIF